VTCSLGTLASGANATATITVTPPTAGTITNSASVVSSVSDPVSANNEASVETVVDRGADLSLAKSDSPDPVLAGELLSYTLTVNNGGPSNATDVMITDTLPSGVAFDSASASQGSCTEQAGTVTCDVGTIADGATVTATINVRPQTDGTITNTASVTSSKPDPASANNQASAETTVEVAAGLSINKSDSPDPVLAGGLLTYTLTVNNGGPFAATGVSVSDVLPGDVVFESASASQGFCQLVVQTVSCGLGTLANGGTATVTIGVTPQAEGTITNTASVLGSEPDPNVQDNSDSVQTTVEPGADLALTMAASPEPVTVGGVLTYSIVATNNGPSIAGGVSVSDTLPKSVRLRSANSDRGRCIVRTRGVDCNLGELASQESSTITIVVRPARRGSITNRASVGADTRDPNGQNNEASADTTVG
jgi:uncharacterized repeat protein (TIGR01451 family)